MKLVLNYDGIRCQI